MTGSTKGIGRAIAHALAKNGAEVAINGRKPADVEQAIAAIRATLPTARLVPAPGDAATEQGVAAIIKAAGDVDILVNNVGIFENQKRLRHSRRGLAAAVRHQRATGRPLTPGH